MYILGSALGKGLDDSSINVEEIIAGHTRLAGHSSRDNNDIGALESRTERVGALVSRDLSWGIDVGEVCGDSRGVDNVIEGELCDEGIHFKEEGERLANAASSSQDGNLVGRKGRGREASLEHAQRRHLSPLMVIPKDLIEPCCRKRKQRVARV